MQVRHEGCSQEGSGMSYAFVRGKRLTRFARLFHFDWGNLRSRARAFDTGIPTGKMKFRRQFRS
jgi:hypothetical protein